VEGIKQYTTQSSEGIGTANIEVRENYDVDDVLERVRTKDQRHFDISGGRRKTGHQ
jgi:hypothetical protein